MKNNRSNIYIPDEELPNFFEVKSGNMAAGTLYRSSSPLKGGDKKKIKGALAIKAGIKSVINLDDNSCVIENLSKDVEWYHKLLIKGNVICLPMTISIPGVASNKKKLKAALQFIIAKEGPYLIHCFAGIDRTGFVIALLEALMGASLKEILKGYLSAFSLVYNDVFSIEDYRKMENLLKQLKKAAHGKDIATENIQTIVKHYLLNDIGLSQDEVIQLENKLNGANSTVSGQKEFLCLALHDIKMQ